MSFRTFGTYNGDNVNRTIEVITSRQSVKFKSNKEADKMDKILKDALNVHVGNVMWEPTMDGRWFNWKEHVSYTKEAFKDILRDLKEGVDYEVLKV